jgi:hypothetical protein
LPTLQGLLRHDRALKTCLSQRENNLLRKEKMKMKTSLVVGVLLITAITVGAFQAGAAEGHGKSPGEVLLKFTDMVGIAGVFVGNALPQRDIPGGGFTWVITDSEARLMDEGKLKVNVTGLVIDPTEPAAQSQGVAGINPVPRFFATLSCLDAKTGAVINLNTATVPATQQGNAEINTTLDFSLLPPESCLAPIVFVRGDLASIPGNPFHNPEGPDPADPWFAASGF